MAGGDPGDGSFGPDAIMALAAAPFEIAFHTLRHDRLTGLGDSDLQAAMTLGRRDLENLTGQRLATIGYPHGRADARVATAARQAGFDAGFTSRHTVVTPGEDPHLLGRFSPPSHRGSAFPSMMAHVFATTSRP